MMTGCAGQRDAAFLIQLCCAKECVQIDIYTYLYMYMLIFTLNWGANPAVINPELLYHSLLWICLGAIL